MEHDRVYVFDNKGDKRVYLSSADWMTRNIDYRIEVAVSLLDPALKQRVLDILEILFSDTVKARYVDKELSNQYVPRGNRRKVRAQVAIYEYLKLWNNQDSRPATMPLKTLQRTNRRKSPPSTSGRTVSTW